MKTKNWKKLLSVMMLLGLFGGTGPVLAIDGLPVSEEAAKVQQQISSSGSVEYDSSKTGAASAIDNAVKNQPSAMSNIDFKKFGPMPEFSQGGPKPRFMGTTMAGPDMDQTAGRIGNALESIKEGLTSSEEGIQEMKDGQIKIDPAMGKSVTGARPIYNAAAEAFQAGDYQTAADKLQELQKVGFDKKYADFADKQGVSADMIKDIRVKLNDSLKQISQIDQPDEQLSAQADIMTQMNYLDNAEKSLNQGKKKQATQILKTMRQNSGQGSAEANLAGGKMNMSATQIGKVLDKINIDLTRAGKGLEKAKDRDIAISSELQEAMDKTKALYEQAKEYYDAGDYTKAVEILKQMKDFRLKELSMSYRDKMLPPGRLKSILQEGKNGAKALKISIDKAKEYGFDTADLEKLSAELESLLLKAEEALNAKDTDLFLTIMGEAEALKARDKVDAAIRIVAQGRAKEILGQGLTAVKTAIEQLNSAVEAIANKNGAVANAKELVGQASSFMAKAQLYLGPPLKDYDQTDYMSGGRQLDDAAEALIRAGNILRDSGAKVSKEQLNSTGSLVKILNSAGDLSNVDSNMMGEAQSLLSNLAESSIMESKQIIRQFNPGLLDKVLAFRQKDQKLIDNIINEVMPLLPELDRQAMMEGKINLLEEAVSAAKTIKVMQSLKDLNKSAVGDLQNIVRQVKDYNFTAKIADKLDEKISDFNDKIQSGEVKDALAVNNYVKALKQEVAQDIKSSQAEKFKQKMIPAKNIDDNNPLFAEIKYLKDDGAIAADKNGNINVGQIVSGKAIADIVNKTQDKNIMKPLAGGKITVKDAAQKIIESYGVKAQANSANAAEFAGYLNKLGADIKRTDLNKSANLGQIAEIVAAADQEWGNK